LVFRRPLLQVSMAALIMYLVIWKLIASLAVGLLVLLVHWRLSAVIIVHVGDREALPSVLRHARDVVCFLRLISQRLVTRVPSAELCLFSATQSRVVVGVACIKHIVVSTYSGWSCFLRFVFLRIVVLAGLLEKSVGSRPISI